MYMMNQTIKTSVSNRFCTKSYISKTLDLNFVDCISMFRCCCQILSLVCLVLLVVSGSKENISEMMKLNVPMAMKIAFDGLHDSEYKTRDTSISDVGKFEKVELSLLLCKDKLMQKLNKDWRGVDATTDVLSMSQHIPEIDIPVLMLGDIVISVETAARQAEERGHTLLDEIRILMIGKDVSHCLENAMAKKGLDMQVVFFE